MNFDAWCETTEGISCLSHLTVRGFTPQFARRVLKACYTSGELSGRCEGMSEALEMAVRTSAAKNEVSASGEERS